MHIVINFCSIKNSGLILDDTVNTVVILLYRHNADGESTRSVDETEDLIRFWKCQDWILKTAIASLNLNFYLHSR